MSRLKKLPSGVEFGGWRIETVKGPILGSAGGAMEAFHAELAPLPALPEEVYSHNMVRFTHIKSGETVTLTALDALRAVDPARDLVKVAYARQWASAREGVGLDPAALKVLKPYDWTFTSAYNGTLSSGLTAGPTDHKIDFESLKVREPILFHDEVHLYGDDFGDNGVVLLAAQVRVMPSSFYALLRLFVRVDDVLVRTIETRLWCPFTGPDAATSIIREVTHRETSIPELEAAFGVKGDRRAALAIYRESQLNTLIPRLPIVSQRTEQISVVPASSSAPTMVVETGMPK